MKRLFSSSPKSPTRILSDILLLRSDPSFHIPGIDLPPTAARFLDLPDFKKSIISQFSTHLSKSNTLQSALEKLPFQHPYSSAHISALVALVNSGEIPSDLDILIFLYQCFAWFSSGPSVQSSDSFAHICRILNTAVSTAFLPYCNAIFSEFISLILSTQKKTAIRPFTNPILSHFEANDSLDWLFFTSFARIVGKVLAISEVTEKPPVISLIRRFFDEDRKLIRGASYAKLISHLTRWIRQLDVDAIAILCKASAVDEDKIVIEQFMGLPELIIRCAEGHRAEALRPEFGSISRDWALFDVQNDPGSFVMPPQELVDPRVDISELYDKFGNELLEKVVGCFQDICEGSATAFIASLSNLVKDIINSKEYYVILAFLIPLLDVIAGKTSVDGIVRLMINGRLFNVSETVFSRIGIIGTQNSMRNSALNFLSTHAFAKLEDLFVHSAASPLLFAELLLRTLFCHSLTNDFFATEPFMSSLISVALNIQQTAITVSVPGIGYAKSVIFKTLFGLLDDRLSTSICMQSQNFVTGFLSLMFEPNFTSIVVQSLSNCLSQISALPTSVADFVILVFESCSEHHEQFAQLGKDLSLAIVRALSHTVSLPPYFDKVLDPALAFLQYQPNAEMLHAILTIMMLVTQTQRRHEIPDKRFKMLLAMVNAVEGHEPSDATFLKFQNVMNASTNLSMGLLFLIRVPEIIPIVLLAFAHSRRLADILDFFLSLGRYSMWNIFCLHVGEVDLLLLRALYGKFEYRGLMVDFDFSSDSTRFIKQHVIELVAMILTVRSSFEVDRAICDLITPDKSGKFSSNGPLAIETITLVFSSLNRHPSPQFPIVSTNPMIEFPSFDASRIREGFVFAFRARIDSVKTRAMIHRFVILAFHNNNRRFMFSHHQGGFYAIYEADGMRTSASLAKEFVTQGWVYFILSLRELDGVWVLAIENGEDPAEEVEFKRLSFDMPIRVMIGQCEGASVPISEESPVALGPFVLFSLPLEQDEREALIAGTLDGLLSPRLILSSSSTDLIRNHSLWRKPGNLMASLKLHFSVYDFISIFKQLRNAPRRFGEITVGTLTRFVNLAAIRRNDLVENVDHGMLLHNVAGIEQLPTGVSPIMFSRLSTIPIIVLLASREILSYQFYLSLFNFMDSLSDAELTDEIFHHLLFNPWIWCAAEPFAFQRICKHWSLMLSRSTQLISERTFPDFLVQTHLMVNFSNRDFSDFAGVRLRLLEQLTTARVEFIGVSAVIAVLQSVRDRHPELINYMQLLLTMASTCPSAFPSEAISSLIDLVGFSAGEDAFLLVLQVIQVIGGPSLKSRVAQLCISAFSQGVKVDPTSLDVICIKALFATPPDFNFMRPPSDDDFWYFWPIIIALVYHQEAANSVADFLLEVDSDYNSILDFIELCKALGIEFAFEFRDILVQTALARSSSSTVFVESFVSLFHAFKLGSFSSEFVNLAAELQTDLTALEFAVPRRVSLTPFSVSRLQALTHLPINHHHYIFERQPTSVNLSDFVDSFEFVGEFQIIPKFLRGDKTVSNFSLFNVLQAESVQTSEINIKLLLHKMADLFSFPPPLGDCVMHYQTLIGCEKARWDLLIQHGAAELSSSLLSSEDDFHISGQLIECPIPRLRKPSISQDWSQSPIVIMPGPLASLNCELLIGSSFVTAALDIFAHAFQFRTYRSRPLFVIHAMISFVRMESDITIILQDSTCFELRLENKSSFASICKTLDILIVSNPRQYADKISELWSHGKLTNFDYILSLNLLFSRSFCALSKYPYFPVVVSRQSMIGLNSTGKLEEVDFTKWFDESDFELDSVLTHTSFPPEVYGSLALLRTANVRTPDWAPSTEQFVYHYRKSLENPALSDSISHWVKIQFGFSKERVFHRPVLQQFRVLKPQQCLHSEVDSAGVIGNFQNLVFTFSGHNQISLLLADWNQSITLTPMSDFSCEYSRGLELSRGEAFLVGYDPQTMTVFKSSPDQRTTSHNYAVFLTSVTVFRKSVIYVVDYHDVFICQACDFPENAHHFFGEIEPIARIVADSCVGILIVLTRSGKMKVISLFDGRVFGELNFAGQSVRTILVTEVWHLIVLEVGLDLHVVTMYGKVLKTVQLFKPIEKAVSFRIANGNDFVAFVDGDRKFQLFEVMYPEKLQVIGKTKSETVALEYLKVEQMILLIENNGIISRVKFPILG